MGIDRSISRRPGETDAELRIRLAKQQERIASARGLRVFLARLGIKAAESWFNRKGITFRDTKIPGRY